MITIDVSTATHRGGSFDPSFTLIRTTVNKNVERSIRLRRISADVLKPEHFLITLLNAMAFNRKDSDDEMYYRLRDRVYMLGTSLKLVTPTSYGEARNNFMMDGCDEYIFLHCNDFERYRWQNLNPIEFIYHEETNINTFFGNGGDKTNYALISINIFMLAYQFRCWLRERVLTGSTETIRAFLYKYPVTNAIYSYTDISLFNRHLYMQQGWEIRPDAKHNQMKLQDVEAALDKHVASTNGKYEQQTRTVSQNLYGTELFFKLSALELIPNIPHMRTRQTGWFFDLAKLPLILYGDTFMRNTNIDYNKGQLSTWRRELTQTFDRNTWSRLRNAAPHIKDKYQLFFT